MGTANGPYLDNVQGRYCAPGDQQNLHTGEEGARIIPFTTRSQGIRIKPQPHLGTIQDERRGHGQKHGERERLHSGVGPHIGILPSAGGATITHDASHEDMGGRVSERRTKPVGAKDGGVSNAVARHPTSSSEVYKTSTSSAQGANGVWHVACDWFTRSTTSFCWQNRTNKR